MEYSEGRLARVFVIKMEEGEEMIGSLARFLAEKGVESGIVHFLGALREGRLIMGPRGEGPSRAALRRGSGRRLGDLRPWDRLPR